MNQFFSRLTRFGADASFVESFAGIERGSQTASRIVPYMEKEEIEALCQNVLKKANYFGGPVPLDEICQSLSKDKGLDVRHRVSLAPGILGRISFNPPIIEVDEIQADSLPRSRFTLAHELGHLFLDHQKYMEREACHESDVDLDNSEEIGVKDIVRMEWQANCFASFLLLPTDYLVKAFRIEAAKQSLVDRGYGPLYLDGQQCNMNSFNAVTSPITSEFQVSRSVVKIRLKQLGLLTEREPYKRIGRS